MTSSFVLPRLASHGDAAEVGPRLRVLRADDAPHAPPATARRDIRRDAEMDAFLDQLAELPVTDWLSYGRALAGDHKVAGRLHRARIALESMLLEDEFAMDSWRACDAVETALFLAMRRGTRWTREQHQYFALAHLGIRCAVLAMLTGDYLDRASFRDLTDALTTLVTPMARERG